MRACRLVDKAEQPYSPELLAELDPPFDAPAWLRPSRKRRILKKLRNVLILLGVLYGLGWYNMYSESIESPTLYFFMDGTKNACILACIAYAWYRRFTSAEYAARSVLFKRCNILSCVIISFFVIALLLPPALRSFDLLLSPGIVTSPKISYDAVRKRIDVEGILSFGATGAFERQLALHPETRSLSLTSPGGMAVEGIWLGNAIQNHRLSAYVPHYCGSACTYALAGGTERIMQEEARLAFHFPIIASSDKNIVTFITDVHRRYLAKKGIHADFIDRIFRAPVNDPWFPTHQELLASGMVTKIEP